MVILREGDTKAERTFFGSEIFGSGMVLLMSKQYLKEQIRYVEFIPVLHVFENVWHQKKN